MNDLVLFSKEWEAKTREIFLPGMPDAEVAVFMEICKLRNLNPFTKQVHFLPFWDEKTRTNKFAMVISIDGFRSLAARTGFYGGQDEPIFTYDKHGLLVSCKIAVYRKDFARPTVAIAHLSEYQRMVRDRQTGNMVANSTWKKSPHIMLSKCAEALALRKAFPDDLGGLYEEAELGVVVDSELATSTEEEPKAAPKSRADAMVKKFAPKATPQEAEIVAQKADAAERAKRLMQMANHDMGNIFEKSSSGGIVEDDVPPPTDDDAPPPSAPKSIDHYAQQVLAKLGGKIESQRNEGDYVFSFGKFKDKAASEVDIGGLKWIAANATRYPEAQEAAKVEIERRGK